MVRMFPTQHRVFLWAAPLVVGGWCLVAFVNSRLQPDLYFSIFYGTLLGQTTVAAAWCALGPGRLLLRLPISLLWVVMLAVAIVVHGKSGSRSAAEEGVMIGCALIGQWLLSQSPLWLLAAVCRLKLRHAVVADDPRDWQFSIRRLIILTALVAVLMGIARLVGSAFTEPLVSAPWLRLAFWVVVAPVLSLPSLLAVLLRRYAIWATLGSLVIVAMATASEDLVWRWVGLPAPPPPESFFIALNSVTIAWVLAFGITARRCGYLLRTSR